MKVNKQTILTVIKVVAFTLILCHLFLFFTYLFRDTSLSGRQNILEYYDEQDDTVDVVFIGASNVMRYWDPMQAWHDYGFTSWNFAVTSLSGECYLSAIKEALKTQSPKLVVVETRTFGRAVPEGEIGVGARKLFDSMDFNLDRLRAVRHYCKIRNIPWKDAVSMYIDLIYYHNNHEALVTNLNWQWSDNRAGKNVSRGQQYKGFATVTGHIAYEDPSENLTEEIDPLNEDIQPLLEEIIAYCQKENIELLLLASPIVITRKEAMRFNAVAQLAEEHGVAFLDTNRHYEEMDLDFYRDFQDPHHTNEIGATKFTDYLGSYLAENYDLPDHREDKAYVSWHELYEEYLPKKENRKESIRRMTEDKEKVLKRQNAIRNTQDIREWFVLADNNAIDVLIVHEGPISTDISLDSKLMLKGYGIGENQITSERGFLIAYRNTAHYNTYTMKTFTGKIGARDLKYTLAIEEKPSIVIDGVEYLENCPEDGIYMVAMNHKTGEVFDRIAVFVESDGSLSFEHF